MSKVFPSSIIIDANNISRRPAQIFEMNTSRTDTLVWEKVKRFIDIDVDIIKHDKWYKINIVLSVLSFILALIVSFKYPPCEEKKIPIWFTAIKFVIYSATAFVWIKTQIGIYRHHYPTQLKIKSITY